MINIGAAIIPAGIHCLCGGQWGMEGYRTCQLLCFWMGLPVIPLSRPCSEMNKSFSSHLPLVFFKLLVLCCICSDSLGTGTLLPNTLQALLELRPLILKFQPFKSHWVVGTQEISLLSLSKASIMGIHPPHLWAPQCESWFSVLCATGSLPTGDGPGPLCSQTTS